MAQASTIFAAPETGTDLPVEPRSEPPAIAPQLPPPVKPIRRPTIERSPQTRSRLLVAALSRVARPYPSEPKQAAGRDAKDSKRSTRYFGAVSPAGIIGRLAVDDLDPLPFVTDDRIPRQNGELPPDEDRDKRARRGPADSVKLTLSLAHVRKRYDARSDRQSTAGGQPGLRGRLLDLSLGGLAMNLSDPAAPGTILHLRISSPDSRQAVEIRGNAIRCQQAGDGGFQVVCRLERLLSFAEIREIGRELFASAIV
jgi:hypothetical protein